MRNRTIKIIYCLLVFASTPLFASENENINQIVYARKVADEINKLTFMKAGGGSWERYFYLYYNKNKIKKVKYGYNYPEGGEEYIIYFDKKGKVFLIIFSRTFEDRNIFGNIYYLNSDTCSYNLLRQSDSNESIYERVSEKEASKLVKSTNLADIEELKKKYQTDISGDIDSNFSLNPGSEGRCIFRNARVNDYVNINANGVNVRKSCSTNVEIIGSLKAFQTVKVKEIGKKENIKPWGTYNWVKIEFGYPIKQGWILGAFIEPLEEACE